jgi:hypothetical protein
MTDHENMGADFEEAFWGIDRAVTLNGEGVGDAGLKGVVK